MHVAITGASSGIGEALAREYLRAGAAVSLVARRRDRMEALAKEGGAGAKTYIHPLDLADTARACEWIEPAVAALGPIDVLVNNAAIQIVEPAAASKPDEIERLLKLDLISPLLITRAVLPAMLARRSGTIVDVASMAALAPTPGMYYYNAAKGGLAAASESLRGELRGTGVHVVTVYPGPVDTDMARAAYPKYAGSKTMTVLPQGTPDVLARLVRRAVERRKARVIYPRSYALSRHFPAATRWLLDRLTPPLKMPPPA